MKTEDFYFDLPKRLIAQTPLKDRSSSRMMVLTGDKIEHRIFKDIVDLLNPGDCLVLNDTKVIPARLIGERKGTGAKVELLLLKRVSGEGDNRWEALAKPGKRVRTGDELVFGGILTAKVVEVKEDGNRIVAFSYDSDKYGVFEEILDKLGEMPLPPYITEKLDEPSRYQTVYAKNEGSAAAPTAGLHFTEELLEQLRQKGVKIAYITLHVGLGTFRPVKVEDVNDHHMHSEFYNIEQEQADLINATKRAGGKIVCVGTTVTRTLESAADDNGFLRTESGWTDIFIYPGYRFKILDELITNFHLPESTLIMLVSALSTRERILNAYAEAVKEEYRFFSFGDAMFIRSQI